MESNTQKVELELAAFSRTLSPEAGYYWERHLPRYRYLCSLIEDLRADHTFDHILDIGMGFQTMLLSRLLPDSQVDCLGVEQDNRFAPSRNFTFRNCDLNDVAVAGFDRHSIAVRYDLIVFMEVLEHLYTPPHLVLEYLASLLNDGGVIILTTPNAAWLKNRLKMLRGKNPFELLKADRKDMGHIREYTLDELQNAFAHTGLNMLRLERKGLYYFNNPKDNFYSRLADATHSSLSRTLVAVYQK